jgi:hypothetical protein
MAEMGVNKVADAGAGMAPQHIGFCGMQDMKTRHLT